MRKLISMSFRLFLGDDRGPAGPPKLRPDAIHAARPSLPAAAFRFGQFAHRNRCALTSVHVDLPGYGNAVRKESASPKPPSVAVVDRVASAVLSPQDC
ncbi:MAG: hypothetical protein EOS71_27470 [Mesorhizobium sp.]|nr:MAG: hypothetical protein EOS71_27470 [Mesorhizobium sp.]